MGFSPRSRAHLRNISIAREIRCKLVEMPPSRYVRRPCCHSWIRARGSHPMRSSTSIAETDLSSARAASAAETMRASNASGCHAPRAISPSAAFTSAASNRQDRMHHRPIPRAQRVQDLPDPLVLRNQVRVLPDSTHVLRLGHPRRPARHTGYVAPGFGSRSFSTSTSCSQPSANNRIVARCRRQQPQHPQSSLLARPPRQVPSPHRALRTGRRRQQTGAGGYRTSPS